ncbi:uncharacterized protein EI90DRAFT_3286910 [Cantharellus anzutake]|uniref:uncharacterized protein n=1 Tax=Cantharellus anzutake TaxID=1750568 RepID=UPI00190471AF|nr:uncharacterized protein EI90DRAFT_3286910 [Cantharellus anzutake]KAF8338218.1 hypothetical protein EI90DRAFT_3286910 [Cantharellus anzutake]
MGPGRVAAEYVHSIIPTEALVTKDDGHYLSVTSEEWKGMIKPQISSLAARSWPKQSYCIEVLAWEHSELILLDPSPSRPRTQAGPGADKYTMKEYHLVYIWQEPLKGAMMERGPEYADSTREKRHVGKVGEPTIIERPAHIKSKEENSGSIEAIEPKANNGSMVPRKESRSTLKERIAVLQANSGLTPPGNGSSRFSTISRPAALAVGKGAYESTNQRVSTNLVGHLCREVALD